MKKILYILLPVLLLACSDDWLNTKPQDALTVETFYQTDEQCLSASATLYSRTWFYFNYHLSFCAGDVMSGNAVSPDATSVNFMNLTLNNQNEFVLEGYLSLFYTVAAANTVLNNMNEFVGEDVSQSVVDFVKGEAYTIRAAAYLYIVQLFGPMPVLASMEPYQEGSLVYRNEVDDIYHLIQQDLEKAYNLLPEDRRADGRASKYVAASLLARMYLSQNDYTNAKEWSGRVINSGQFELLDNYGNLFYEEYDNSKESVLAMQWIACSQWTLHNTHQAWFAASGNLTDVGDGWNSYTPSLDLIDLYEAEDLRRYHTIMLPGDFYPNLVTREGGYTYPADPGSRTKANFKKWVVGSPDEANVCYMSTGNNTYIMRYAEVLLIYAEAAMREAGAETTSDATAVEAYNTIRKRAGLAEVSSFSLEDLRKEKRLEFVLEGVYWYDILRMDRTEARSVISAQDRGYIDGDDNVQSEYVNNISEDDFYIPIPLGDINKNPNLLEDPVPFDFENSTVL